MNFLFWIGMAMLFYALYSATIKQKTSVKFKMVPSIFKRPPDLIKRKVALETLSNLWTRRKDAVVNLEEIAGIWRSGTPKSGERMPAQEPQVEFLHEEIKKFSQTYLEGKAFFNGGTKKTIEEILMLLDREGDCPSVVNSRGEAEASLEQNVYDMLAVTNLRTHTLHVAVEMIKKMEPGPMQAKGIIAALGHDLGKIPSHRARLYRMGDHPLISITLLDQIKGYTDVIGKNEIDWAIKDHHRVPKGFLAEMLKESDQAARRIELTSGLRKVSEEISNPVPSHGSEPKAPDRPEPTRPDEARKNKKAVNPDIFGYEEKKEDKKSISVKIQKLPWMDCALFLEELKPYINRLSSGRWDAFSMKNGYVYVQVKTMWEVTKKVAKAKGETTVLLGDDDVKYRRNVLYSIVEELKMEKEAIARGLVQDGYFGGPFIVTLRDGTRMTKGFYTPFNVEAFEMPVSELENLKIGKLLEIVEVNPNFQGEEPIDQ